MSAKRVAYPFNTLTDAAVGFAGWMIGDVDQPLAPAADILDDWDYDRDLEVSVSLEFDFEEVARCLDVRAEDVVLTVILKAGTGTGSLPRRVDRLCSARVSRRQPHAALSAKIPSQRLSGRLRLEVGIVLGHVANDVGFLSPTIIGSRLWSDRLDILIEGGGSARFPVELVSFADVFQGQGHESAPWYLHWRAGSLQADFAGSVRLYVNADIEELKARFIEGDPLTLQAIMGDVMTQMVSAAVCIEDCEDALEECEVGSTGRQIRNWIDMAFPDQPVSTIRGSMESTPGVFRAALLAAARIGDPE